MWLGLKVTWGECGVMVRSESGNTKLLSKKDCTWTVGSDRIACWKGTLVVEETNTPFLMRSSGATFGNQTKQNKKTKKKTKKK
jgi:hypothetical protein